MDAEFLKDVFHAAINEIRHDQRKHTPEQLKAVLTAAVNEMVEMEVRLMKIKAAHNEKALLEMLVEWDETRQPVATRYRQATDRVTPYDPAWKAK